MSARYARIALGLALLLAAGAARAGALQFSVNIRGVSTTLAGQRFRFTGQGTLTVDENTGQFTLTMALSNGLTLNGTGVMGAGRNVFGTFTFDMAGSQGSGVINGRANQDRTRFNGKFTVGSPNRLGPAPNGFVFSTGNIAARRM